MNMRLKCPRGHQWELAGPVQANAQPLVCPECGSVVLLPDRASDSGVATVAVDSSWSIRASGDSAEATVGGSSAASAADHGNGSGQGAGWPTIPGYEILAELGRGGMGVVYKARQRSLDRLVALKMILAGTRARADDLARFRAEAHAIAQLRHPHIVQVYEVGEHDGQPFFSLEFMECGSLDDRLEGAPQPARPAAQLIETLASAMHFAHQRGIVHRDLKPANVLLTDQGNTATLQATAPRSTATGQSPFGVPKITDFGLAKRLDRADGPTQTGSVLGTPSYMAPEQAWGKNQEVGPAADVYALGAILYELLTGRPPFCAETALETMRQVATEEPVPPSRLQSKVPRDLEVICLKCLEKEPRKRYASAEALADDLHRFLHHMPILARPGGALGRCVKWARRRPTTAALLAATLLAAVGLFAGLAYHSIELGRALNATRQAKAEAEASVEKARQEEQAKEVQRRAADAQRQKAEANFRRARAAVDQMLTRVAEEELAYLPHMEQVREAVLADALRFYEEFLQEKSDDPSVRQEAGRAYRRIGDIYYLLNKSGPALKAYDQALALETKLADDFPADPGYRAELATTYHSQAGLFAATGDLEQAEDTYRKARDLRERLPAEKPDVPAYQLDLAVTCNALGNLLRETGRLDEALACYNTAIDRCQALPREPAYRQELANCYHLLGFVTRDLAEGAKTEANYTKAINLYEELRKDFPAVPEYRLELARVHTDLGVQLRPIIKPTGAADRDRADRSEKEFQAAIALCQQLFKDFPRVPRYRLELARGLLNLGTLHRRREKLADSDSAYRQSLDIAEKLVADFQGVPRYRQELARCINNVAIQLRDTDQPAEARKYLERSLAICRELVDAYPSVPEYKSDLGGALGQLGVLLRQGGKHAEAVQKIEEALQLDRAALEPNRLQPVYRRNLRHHYIELAETQLRLGDYAAAASTAEQIPLIFIRQGDGYARAARFVARCSIQATKDARLSSETARQEAVRKYADRAMGLLTDAVALKYRDADTLRRSPDFRTIRNRDDFKKLLNDLDRKR
jgi:tetratricopeptide (TPR) repeat protein/tRNA A-37 threonylcarbamoyl transferase component Bud32